MLEPPLHASRTGVCPREARPRAFRAGDCPREARPREALRDTNTPHRADRIPLRLRIRHRQEPDRGPSSPPSAPSTRPAARRRRRGLRASRGSPRRPSCHGAARGDFRFDDRALGEEARRIEHGNAARRSRSSPPAQGRSRGRGSGRTGGCRRRAPCSTPRGSRGRSSRARARRYARSTSGSSMPRFLGS